MLPTSKKNSFNGQSIYVGIDTHLRNWSVTILTENNFHKKFSQDSKPEVLANYLQKTFLVRNIIQPTKRAIVGLIYIEGLMSSGYTIL